jgi:hypothetical protein
VGSFSVGLRSSIRGPFCAASNSRSGGPPGQRTIPRFRSMSTLWVCVYFAVFPFDPAPPIQSIPSMLSIPESRLSFLLGYWRSTDFENSFGRRSNIQPLQKGFISITNPSTRSFMRAISLVCRMTRCLLRFRTCAFALACGVISYSISAAEPIEKLPTADNRYEHPTQGERI